MERYGQHLKEHDVEFLTYVKGAKDKLPRDVKMKVDFKNQPKEFLGMYATVSLNNVQEVLYPYFYVVLVAEQGKMMNQEFLNSVKLYPGIISEFKQENDVDILVIRQKTTKKSGYLTKPQTVINTFELGLENIALLFKMNR